MFVYSRLLSKNVFAVWGVQWGFYDSVKYELRIHQSQGVSEPNVKEDINSQSRLSWDCSDRGHLLPTHNPTPNKHVLCLCSYGQPLYLSIQSKATSNESTSHISNLHKVTATDSVKGVVNESSIVKTSGIWIMWFL